SRREELAQALADAGDGAAVADAPPAAAAPARDAQGRFASGADRASTNSPHEPERPLTPAKAGAEPAAGPDAANAARATTPPASWSATAKADFQSLPDHIRKEVLKREADIERGRAQWQSGAERLNRLDAILGPRTDQIRMRGMDETQAVQALFAAQDFLERNPAEGLKHLARNLGVDLRALAAPAFAGVTAPQQPGGAMSPQAQPPAQLQALARDVETLKGALAQQHRRADEAHKAGVLSQVEAFAADPANLYFENVRDRMNALLRAGAASDVADAYQQATWSDPDVRQALLRQAEAGRQGRTSDAARAKAAQARHASGSVTGSPSPGSSPGRGGPAPSLRDELLNAWSHHAV
ncbi:MAG TPA: hypothetical protein VIJ94_19450, partial [Caulobacteraceae bacterium]